MKMKAWILHLPLILAGLLVITLALELISRALFFKKTVLFPRYHSEMQCGDYRIRRIRPNTVFWHSSQDGEWKFEINRQGFRNTRDFEYAKPDSIIRIICLGDSHTEGFEVRQEHTFSAVLEREIRSLGQPAEVYNMGVSGYGTDEELILFENEVWKYKPDFVVIGFFANDYEDNLKTGLFAVQDDRLAATGKENLPGVRILDFINRFYLIRKLSENSYLYSFVFNSIWDWVKSARIEKAKNEAQEADSTASYAVATRRQRTQREILLTTKLLERFFDSADHHGIPVLFVDIPQDNMENSLDESMRSFVASRVYGFIDTKTLIDPYKLSTNTHAPHGHKHISEFTHRMIGLELVKYVTKKKEARSGLSHDLN